MKIIQTLYPTRIVIATTIAVVIIIMGGYIGTGIQTVNATTGDGNNPEVGCGNGQGVGGGVGGSQIGGSSGSNPTSDPNGPGDPGNPGGGGGGACSVYQCTGVGQGDGGCAWVFQVCPSAPSAPTPINGVCSSSHYSCSTGASASNVSGLSTWTWSCNGSNGGTSAPCSENKPTPNGSLSATPSTCQIATGASTCATTLTWTTIDPQGTSGVTRDGRPGLLFSGNSDSKVTNVPYEADGSVTYRLYNNAFEIGTANVTVGCASGVNKWDSLNNECADPQVASAIVTDEYYPPGKITLTCSDSDSYSVSLNGSSFVTSTPYNGPVAVSNVMQEGNYVIKCTHGNVSDQVTRYYDATPEPATVSLVLSPVTTGKDGKVVVSWKTKFPTNACTLAAKVVCPNNACAVQQTAFQATLNTVLQSDKTDDNDPATSRLITTAVKKVAPGHLGTDWLALGKKTLQISYTTDLTYDCGAGNKETKRIQVTKSELQ